MPALPAGMPATTLTMVKEFDIVIFGASGYTGQLVVEEMARNASQEKIRWAVAGRNLHRVQRTLIEVQKNVSDDVKDIKIFETDVTDQTSLELMCRNAKLVINCVGPYDKYGEPMVAACIKSGTHIIDMSVELKFISCMMLKYYHQAESQGVYIVSACGIGYLFYGMAIPVLQEKLEGNIDTIDFHVTPDLKRRSIHIATWESLINMADSISDISAANRKIYSQILKQPHPKRRTLPLSWPVKSIPETNGISLKLPSILHTIYLGMAMNRDGSKQKTIRVNSYFVNDSYFKMILAIFFIFIIMLLRSFSYGKRLLTNYPEIFTCGVVTKSSLSENARDSSQGDFIVIATESSQKKDQSRKSTRSPDKRVILRGSGPPAYKTTAICLVQAAITVLKETDRLPNRGGMYTPLAAFSETSLPSRLQNHGIIYE